jgi:glutathione S-transferase
MSTLTLYHTQPTRSVKIFVLLEELGLEYSVKHLDFKKKEQKTPEYLALNPLGKVPTLTDGDVVIWESSAIAYYLLEKYDVKRTLSPPPGTRENAVHHQVCCHESEHDVFRRERERERERERQFEIIEDG